MTTSLYEQRGVWDAEMVLGQRHLLTALLDFWPAGVESFLDVGCGDGKLTRGLMARTGALAIGVDGSANALSRVGLPAAMVAVEALPIASQAVDAVVCTDVLEHVADDDEPRTWLELFRVARRHVLVAVPYREELAESVTRCPSCGHEYHVNWHQRSYSLRDFAGRVPRGWRLRRVVLSGESWSWVDPVETQFRRTVFGERARWDQSVCPRCGATGTDAPAPALIGGVMAVALGEVIYRTPDHVHESRNHTEMLLILSRDEAAEPPVDVPAARTLPGASHQLPWDAGLRSTELVGYPKVPRLVQGVDGAWVAQFPPPSDRTLVLVASAPAQRMLLVVEDGMGVLVSRQLNLVPGANTVELPRDCVAGYYGILVRLPAQAPVTELRLGSEGREFLIAEPTTSGGIGYYETSAQGVPVHVQVTDRTWLGADQLDPFCGATDAQIPWRNELKKLDSPIAAVQEETIALRQRLDTLARDYTLLQEQAESLARERDALRNTSEAYRKEAAGLRDTILALSQQAEAVKERYGETAARYRRIERLFELIGGKRGRSLLARLTSPSGRAGSGSS